MLPTVSTTGWVAKIDSMNHRCYPTPHFTDIKDDVKSKTENILFSLRSVKPIRTAKSVSFLSASGWILVLEEQ